jgi:hypothetical protein
MTDDFDGPFGRPVGQEFGADFADEPVADGDAGQAIRGDMPVGGIIPALSVPNIRWQDTQARDLFLAKRRARWAFDGRKED